MKRIKILTKKQDCVLINNGKITSYFNLERRMRKGDSTSAFLFILPLEIIFNLININPKIEGLYFFHNFLYPAYADGTTCF